MVSNPFKRLASDIVEADIEAFRALKGVTDYQSTNPRYAYAALVDLHERLRAAQESDVLIQNAAAASRDALALVEHEHHAAILGMRDQVRAQYGMDSDEVAAVGLKKKSERRAPVREKKLDEMKNGAGQA